MALQLHLKPKTLTLSLSLRSLCSSSSSSSNGGGGGGGEGDGDPSSSPSPPSYASMFSDVKERLRSRRAPPRRIPTDPPPPPPFSKPSPPPSIEEVRKHLAGFRLKSSPVNPSLWSSPPISFQELFKSNVIPQNQNDAKSERPSMDSIRASLRQFKSSPADQPPGRRGQLSGSFNIKAFDESLRRGLTQRGDGRLPGSIFGKEVRDKQGEGEGNKEKVSKETEFVKMYGCDELGEKLRKLRPDEAGKGKTGWFSLQELNERLVKLRELEMKESQSIMSLYFSDLHDSLSKLKEVEVNKKAADMQKMSIFLNLGVQTTPDFMRGEPQEHLLENYFHPDHMSSAEKMKLELQKVRDEFKMSESDCGSARVQVAQLTTKIKHLSGVLHKKDKHSRKGLLDMVQRRKKLLKYLRRTDWDSYCIVLSKLGLRDIPEYKIPDYKMQNKDSKVKSKKSGKLKSKKKKKAKSRLTIPA
ncbi:uncharacterized protein LOC120257031 [Dioscorea cayenensis subsp. rotundata]|uniref:Small ribosomal subunit protein uS15c n=1 Tax=Dioscorea cayennensis subsp. rotundata TaxID=55577 RepID=A0AB40B0P0_DIOCR|nr:uncharacterized protein LOC120257031 [Dioscorea cayenensis subsp. rotundata]